MGRPVRQALILPSLQRSTVLFVRHGGVMRASYYCFLCSWMVASVVALAQSNPVPFVDQPLVPMSAAPGGSGFTLTVNGAGFVSGSVVNWSGTPLPTTFVSKAPALFNLVFEHPGAD